MTNEEFDILDELYFLTSFTTLKEYFGANETSIKPILWRIIEKEWVLCHHNGDVEFVPTKAEFETNFANYHYLASKKGLLAHNAR